MKHKIILTGFTGLFGCAFLSKIKKNNHFTVIGINRKIADISDKDRIIYVIKELKPKIIIHAASIGDLDYCESNQKQAWQVNVEGTRNIIEGAKSTNSVLIFLSTNAVYDGKNPPYQETSKRNPICFYGKTKLISEDDLKKSSLSWTIVRFITMYGWHNKNQRKNPVTWLIDGFKKNHKMNIVNDVYNNHLYVGQAAESVLKIIEFRKWGELYNIAGKDCLSRYQLAQEVAKVFSFDKSLIRPVKSSFFPMLAPRPKNTCFVTKKAEKDLGIKPLSVKEGLLKMKNNLL